MKMKGYVVPAGYMGWFKGKWRLFATEDEYEEAFIEDAILNS